MSSVMVKKETELKPYNEYKDSGVEWIGEIPKDWYSCSVKIILDVITDYTANGSFASLAQEVKYLSEPSYSRVVRLTDLRKNLENDGIWVNESAHNFLKKSELFGGEIVVANVGAYTGYVTLVPSLNGKATLGPNMFLIKFKPTMNAQFTYYQLSSYFGFEQLKLASTSTAQPKLNKDGFKSLKCIVPPLTEQKAIAEYLDTKTAQIDSLITQKEKLIELLKEERSAVINQAVTKGLDPNVEMKDSGVEWIGEIPKSWQMKKTSWLFNDIGSGTTPKSSNREYYDGNIPWINTGDLNDGYLNDCKKSVTSKALSDCSALRVYPSNSLIIAMYGATIGKLGITTFEGCTNQACCVMGESDNTHSKFMFYWLMGNKREIIELGYGGGQPNISQDVVKSLRVSYPPFQEQKAIAEFLDSETSRIDQLVEKSYKEINLLKEYRQSLISNVVCGKVKV